MRLRKLVAAAALSGGLLVGTSSGAYADVAVGGTNVGPVTASNNDAIVQSNDVTVQSNDCNVNVGSNCDED